ncbi:MAG TPA: TadE/TadG family type IV pilus assembly protein [Sphingobium sp.]|nr:TadE/TadG family type IV pilus assembly protein [Sphingobium sp.]
MLTMLFSQCVARLREFWSDARGNALMLTALALPVVIGAAGLGVHTIQLSHVKRELQREADSAALAGAYSLYQSQTDSVATAQANKALTQNPLVPGATATITPGAYTSGGTTFTSAMYVRLVSTQQTPLMALFGRSTSDISADARAAVVSDGKVCFLAKENGNNTGITFAGNSTLDMGCGAGTNSTAAKAVDVNGQPTVKVSPIVAVGGIPSSTAYASGTALMANHAALTDPFAGLSLDPSSSDVSNGNCKSGNNNWKDINIASGGNTDDITGTLYPPGCYGTISVQGILRLKPGVYYLANGANNAGLQIGAQAKFTCEGCTFVLTSTGNNYATMDINGGAELHLSASTSGTYSGITIYRDSHAAASNQCCQINGNSASTLSGAFYFPNDTLTFNGTSGMSLTCFQMVAMRLSFSGNATINNTCDDLPNGKEKWSLTAVRLIS